MFPFKNAGTAYAVPCDDTASVINSVSDGAVDLYLPLYYTTFSSGCKEFVENVPQLPNKIVPVLEMGQQICYYINDSKKRISFYGIYFTEGNKKYDTYHHRSCRQRQDSGTL